MLIRMLVNTVSIGGNLLMNVGPTARGYLDYRAEEALQVYADWMKYNSRSIYGCTMAEPEFTAPVDCRYTQSADGSRLYLHLFAYPFAHLRLPGWRERWNTPSSSTTPARCCSPKERWIISRPKMKKARRRPDPLSSSGQAAYPGSGH